MHVRVCMDVGRAGRSARAHGQSAGARGRALWGIWRTSVCPDGRLARRWRRRAAVRLR
ncbi:hypothetical protein CRG98_048715, partial [Punica granatum]